jgi:hypothetical protein
VAGADADSRNTADEVDSPAPPGSARNQHAVQIRSSPAGAMASLPRPLDLPEQLNPPVAGAPGHASRRCGALTADLEHEVAPSAVAAMRETWPDRAG